MRIITTNNIAYKKEFLASNKDELKTAKKTPLVLIPILKTKKDMSSCKATKKDLLFFLIQSVQ